MAIHGFQPQHVFAAQTADRSGKVGLAARPLANLTSRLWSNLRVGGEGHLFQHFRNLSLGKYVEEGRLSKGYVQRRFQSVVEYRVACAIGKIGQNDCVFPGQSIAGTRMIVKSTGEQQGA